MKHALLIALSALCFGAACAAPSGDPPADPGAENDEMIAQEPIAMPAPILTFLRTNGWGKHHLEWHTIRNWDRLGPSDQAYAKRQGWAREELQEGMKGNGLEFLAMHRAMFQILTSNFADNADLFHGWDTPPTDAADERDPVPAGNDPAFDENKKAAIDKLQNHLADFASDDELGLFIETSMRPTAQDPTARSQDKSAGIHNYLHNRFSGDSKTVDIGDPSVNLGNRRFWRLHGWIESRWTEFRHMKNLSDSDPAYQAAIEKGQRMLENTAKGGLGGPNDEPPPASLRKFFAQDP
jgi:hypothetical protein